jgi:ATP/maltotriose-dependent transcriptional regulator MalT
MAGLALYYLALTHRELGNIDQAVEELQAGLELSVTFQDHQLLSLGIDAALRLAADRAEPATRAQLLGARDALNEITGVAHGIWEQWSGQSDAALRRQVEREGWGDAYQQGRILPFRAIARLAAEMLDALAPKMAPPEPVHGQASAQGPLSAREMDVLGLVAEGLSSKAIGKQLTIAVSTVNYHLTSIFNKLGVDTRAQAVAVAARRQLL